MIKKREHWQAHVPQRMFFGFTVYYKFVKYSEVEKKLFDSVTFHFLWRRFNIVTALYFDDLVF